MTDAAAPDRARDGQPTIEAAALAADAVRPRAAASTPVAARRAPPRSPPTAPSSSSAPPSPAASSSPSSSSALPADEPRQPTIAEAITEVSERAPLLVREEIELAKAEIDREGDASSRGRRRRRRRGRVRRSRRCSSRSTRPPGAPT